MSEAAVDEAALSDEEIFYEGAKRGYEQARRKLDDAMKAHDDAMKELKLWKENHKSIAFDPSDPELLHLEKCVSDAERWLSQANQLLKDAIQVRKEAHPERNESFSTKKQRVVDDETTKRTKKRRSRVNADDKDDKIQDDHVEQPAEVGIHLVATSRMCMNRQGQITKKKFQGRCMVCREKTSYQCSDCKMSSDGKAGWVCRFHTGRWCFSKHLLEKHDLLEKNNVSL